MSSWQLQMSGRGKPGEASQKRARTSPSYVVVAPGGGGGVVLGNPRIVRASSRAPGGKDRHSKVATVRGLRDRRVRLSVPTAVLLYDLQDRLGLGQPSKVVDWLLHAARHAIDRLPPLPAGLPLDVSRFSTAVAGGHAATRERRRLVDVGTNGQCAYGGQWDIPLDSTAHVIYTGGGHSLQPQASCSTASSAPTFDQAAFGSKVQYGYYDHGGGGSRSFSAQLQDSRSIDNGNADANRLQY